MDHTEHHMKCNKCGEWFDRRDLTQEVIQCSGGEKIGSTKNHLPDIFYTMPAVARCTMTRNQIKETLLATDGKILTCGRLRNLYIRHLAVGIYEVTIHRERDCGD